MNNIAIIALVILVTELVATILFIFIGNLNGKKTNKNKVNRLSVLKGIAERTFLTFALVNKIPQALIVFAALKIATRIKDDQDISNDFYLLGNLISITQAILYTKLISYYFYI